MTKKILIAEDEEDICELLSTVFDDFADCIILRAMDGEEAIRLARVNNPDILLLDIHLPKINGYEVCKSVKSNPSMAHSKVLIVSGMAQHYDQLKAKKAGADGYIAKPFSSVALIEKVKKLLTSNQES